LSKTSELIPNSFQVPNLLVDRLLPHLSGPQVKILLPVCRKTFGWGKRTDLISFGQFQKEAKLSRSSVCETLESFVRAGLLLKSSRGPLQVNGWTLNLEADAEAVIRFLKEASKTVKNPVCIAQRTRDSSPGEPTETQETINPMSNGRANGIPPWRKRGATTATPRVEARSTSSPGKGVRSVSRG
jgi:hypothetical protein